MKTVFSGKKITGILSVLPQRSYTFEEETTNFPSTRAARLKNVMGYGERRRAKVKTTTSQLCIYGLNYLIETEKIKREEIGAVIVVTLTPDFLIPHVSNIIHGECKLSSDVICMDIPQACTGYVIGLFNSFMMLEHMKNKKVLLFTGDVLHRKEKDDEVFEEPPFGGDAATISIIENIDDESSIYMDIRTNGFERNTLIYPANGFHFCQGERMEESVDIGDGVKRNPYALNMDGSAVFNFVQREVPPMLDELFDYAGMKKESMDWFLFHQPNRFMLEKLAEKINVPKEKMFMDIVEKYGNSNSSTIPIVITENLAFNMVNDEQMCCMSGFGGGLSLGGILLKMGNMKFCEMIESDL